MHLEIHSLQGKHHPDLFLCPYIMVPINLAVSVFSLFVQLSLPQSLDRQSFMSERNTCFPCWLI